MDEIKLDTNRFHSPSSDESVWGDPVEEYFDNIPPWIRPERALLASTLERAKLDLVLSEVERHDAIEWIEDEANEETPFSFRWTCDHLGLEYDTARQRFAQLICTTKGNGHTNEYHVRRNAARRDLYGRTTARGKTRPGEIAVAPLADESSRRGGEGATVWCD